MFDKKSDICLKIINLFLIVICVLSLGIAIGNNYYNENDSVNCSAYSLSSALADDIQKQAKADYESSCKYASAISSDDSVKKMYVGYSVFITSLAGLIIVNLFSKKGESSKK